MRKKLLGLAAAAAIVLSGIGVSSAMAQDADLEVYAVKETEDSTVVTAYTDADDPVMYAAGYSGDDLIDVEEVKSGRAVLSGSADSAKLFCWNDAMTPLFAPAEINLEGGDHTEFLKIKNLDYYNCYDGDAILDAESIRIYEDGSSSANIYRLPMDARTNAKLYVNGVEYSGDLAEGLTDYLVYNYAGSMSLTDKKLDGIFTDGKYEVISVTYRGVGQVAAASDNGSELVVGLNTNIGLLSRINIPYSDPEFSVNVTMNGEPAELSDIREGDVISVMYDVNDYVQYSSFMDIEITRGTVSGYLEQYIPGNGYTPDKCVIDGKEYDVVSGIMSEEHLGYKFEVWQDMYGRIIYAEAADPEGLILERVYKQSETGNFAADVINERAELMTCVMSEDMWQDLYDICYSDNDNADWGYEEYNQDGGTQKRIITDRIILARLSPSNEIIEAEQERVRIGRGEYSKPSNYVSGVGSIAEDAVIINADAAADMNEDETITALEYSAEDISLYKGALVDGVEYTVLGANRDYDLEYRFVLVLDVWDTTEEYTNILEDVYTDEGGAAVYMSTISSSGWKTDYIVNSDEVSEDTLMSLCFDESGAKRPISERVMTYAVNSTGVISVTPVVTDVWYGEYDESAASIGGVSVAGASLLRADAAADWNGESIVAGEYLPENIFSIKTGELIDGESYGTAAVRGEDGAYEFVMIFDGVLDWGANSPMAVFDSAEWVQYNGENCYAVQAYAAESKYTNVPVTLYMSETAAADEAVTGMSRGDVFSYRAGEDNYIASAEDIAVLTLYESDKLETTSDDTLENIYNAEKLNTSYSEYEGLYLASNTLFDDTQRSDTDDEVRFFMAPVIERSGNSIVVGEIDKLECENGATAYVSSEYDEQVWLWITDDVNIYSYDFGEEPEYRLSLGNVTDAGVWLPSTVRPSWDGVEINVIDNGTMDTITVNANDVVWNSEDQVGGYTKYVFAKAVNGDITDLLIFLPR